MNYFLIIYFHVCSIFIHKTLKRTVKNLSSCVYPSPRPADFALIEYCYQLSDYATSKNLIILVSYFLFAI